MNTFIELFSSPESVIFWIGLAAILFIAGSCMLFETLIDIWEAKTGRSFVELFGIPDDES